MAEPLEITLEATKPRPIVGEEPALVIGHRVHQDLDMETVELNRNRTSIEILALDRGQPLVLTGQDHMRYHRIHPLTEVGAAFRAPAGSAWTAPLHLLQYGPGLESGRYRVRVAYRYGDSEAQTVRTNAVEFEVLPARHLSHSYRWLGGSDAWGSLANLWRAETGGSPRWIYQVASRKDPALVMSAVDLGIPEQAAGYAPTLAHINDIADLHFERFAVWAEPEQVGFVKIHTEGRSQEVRRVAHGLRDAAVVEPPLHHRDGVLSVVLLGTDAAQGPCACLLTIGDGGTERTVLPLQGAPVNLAAVAWPENDTPAAGLLYWGRRGERQVQVSPLRLPPRTARIDAGGTVLAMAIEQWLGAGRLCLLIREQEILRLLYIPILAAPQKTERPIQDMKDLGEPVAEEPVDFQPNPNRDSAVVLYRGQGWLVFESSELRRLAFEPNHSAPHVVTVPKGGPFLVEFDSNRGFVVRPLREPEPPPLL